MLGLAGQENGHARRESTPLRLTMPSGKCGPDEQLLALPAPTETRQVASAGQANTAATLTSAQAAAAETGGATLQPRVRVPAEATASEDKPASEPPLSELEQQAFEKLQKKAMDNKTSGAAPHGRAGRGRGCGRGRGKSQATAARLLLASHARDLPQPSPPRDLGLSRSPRPSNEPAARRATCPPSTIKPSSMPFASWGATRPRPRSTHAELTTKLKRSGRRALERWPESGLSLKGVAGQQAARTKAACTSCLQRVTAHARAPHMGLLGPLFRTKGFAQERELHAMRCCY